MTTVGEAIDPTQLPINRFRKGERIQAGPELLKSADLSRIAGAGSDEAIQGREGHVIVPAETGAHAGLTKKLHGWLIEIHHEAELIAEEVIDGRLCLERVIAVPAEQLADACVQFFCSMWALSSLL